MNTMKGLMSMFKFKKISFILLAGVLGANVISCSTCNQLTQQEDPSIIGGYTSQFTFDAIKDSGISDYNPRLKTVVVVSRQNPSSVAFIRFYNIKSKQFALEIQDVLNKDGVKTDIIGYADDSKKPSEVSVYLKFKPLDQALVSQNKSESGSLVNHHNDMENITSVLNSNSTTINPLTE